MIALMRTIIIIILLLPSLLLARQKVKITHPGVEIPYEPWFTGPLLAPTAVNMEIGHPAIEPFLFVFNTYGKYDSSWKLKNETTIWAINPLVDFQFAVTKRTGVEVIASFVTNIKDGQSKTHFEDTILLLGYQVSDDKKDSWVPDFRFLFQTIFPSGNYHQLDPILEGIDATGQGAYFFGPNLSFQKLFYLPENFFVLHWSFGYFYPTKTKIKNHNAYGGGFGTKGTIRPGQIFLAFLSGEYSFNQRWGFAFDLQFFHQTKTTDFNGRAGITTTGEPGTVGLPAATQIAF
nr:hypothetical protein [Chlamydiota bacterium]